MAHYVEGSMNHILYNFVRNLFFLIIIIIIIIREIMKERD